MQPVAAPPGGPGGLPGAPDAPGRPPGAEGAAPRDAAQQQPGEDEDAARAVRCPVTAQPLGQLRCLDVGHEPPCRCMPPPCRPDEGDYELCGDPGKKNGEKKLRALLCRTPEWADAAARAAVAESCDAAAADDESGAFATLAAVMRGADTSASLRKSHLLMLARCWGYQSSLWVRKESRKRMPLQPEPLPPPLHPRRSESLAAAAAARAAAEEARRAAAFQQHPPGSAFPRAFPCVASAITAALADSSGGGSGGAMQPGEAGRYSSTLSDGAAALMGAPPSNRSSTTSVALPSDVEAGVRAWLAIDAAAPGLAQAAAEAEARAWRERAAAHVAASAPQHTAGPLHWGVAPPIEQWLAQPHGGVHPHQQAPSAAVMEALAAAMERGEEYVDDPMTWGY